MSQRPLRLSFHQGLVCGVCGGIAVRLGWQPWIVRVLYVAASILSAAFPCLLVYAILYLLMPGPESIGKLDATSQ